MDERSNESQAATQRWWLSTTGKAQGPFSEQHVLDALKSGEVPVTTHACPVGGTQWKLVGQWPPFAEMMPPATEVVPPPPTPPVSHLDDSPLTNPQLPTIANWICIYAILICPAYWVVDNLSFCVSGPSFHEDSKFFGVELLLGIFDFFASLIAMVLMVIGGLKLRQLKQCGPMILKWTMLIYIGISMLEILVMIGTLALTSETDFAESTPAADVISFFLLVVALALLAFEIFAILWLHRNSDRLPLKA
ncbi:hypothetical protein GC197_16630 [bacterium]|nr:hypothetical protein [bacterium]